MGKKSSVAIPNLVKQTAVVCNSQSFLFCVRNHRGKDGGGAGDERERILLSDEGDCKKP